jgi:hypothetical protein
MFCWGRAVVNKNEIIAYIVFLKSQKQKLMPYHLIGHFDGSVGYLLFSHYLISNPTTIYYSSNYSDFLKRHLHLRNRLLDQGYKKIRLIRSLKKFIFRYQYFVEIYSVSAEKIISDAFSYSENV